MKNLINITFLVFISLLSITIYSQEVVVSGVVLSSSGDPFSGSIVVNKKTGDSLRLGFDAKFSLIAEIGDVLEFTFNKPYSECIQIVNHLVKKEEDIKIMLLEKSEIEKRYCNRFPVILHVIVGRLINNEEFRNNESCSLSFDYGRKFSYIIEESLYGDFGKDSISFNAYEHATVERFSFSKSKYALLFVAEFCNGKYNLFRSQAYNAYKTSNNRFAIRFTESDYYKNEILVMKPQPIDFGNLKFNLSDKDFVFTDSFKPYYKINHGKAIPKMGNYVEDVLEYWKTIDRFKFYFE